MEILQAVWLSFNIIFGLWTCRNLAVRFSAFVRQMLYIQNQLGKFIDMFILSSILAYSLVY